MKSPLIIIILLFINTVIFSQQQFLDTTFRDKLISNKSELYKKVNQVELQSTENQDQLDITYYSLNLIPNPETSVLSGVVEVVAKVVGSEIDHLDLNFWSGMNILDIHMSHAPEIQLYYTHNIDMLIMTLDRSYLQGEEFRVTIGYNGQPQNSPYESFEFGTNNGEPMIWTLSQPFGSRAWWPCKDIPSDKADSVDIRVTVPGDLIVASNGNLVEKIVEVDKTTYWWHEQYPIATYLVSLAIHRYIVYYDDYLYNDNTDTMKIHYYMFEENFDQNLNLNAQTKDMISFFAGLFGEYPFVEEKYAHVDFLGSGAMEHQTCSSFGFWNQWVVVHELAHQWWGDLITCKDFHHIWLNEGFATYGEALWYEHLNGPGTASYYQMTSNQFIGDGTVYVEDPQNENIFDSDLSYNKASWILHMLRGVVGNDTFFEILKTYYNSEVHQYDTATTEEFRKICEQVSGLNLEKFFHQWVYEEYYPDYEIEWNWVESGQKYEVQLEIKQVQENHIFWMPIDVMIKTNEGEYNFVVWDSLASQSFQMDVPSEPISLEIDKNDWILKTVQEEIINPTFDRGILLVNGVDFDVYESSIRVAYENKAFWGDFPITFWDCFNRPVEGYPSTLPVPRGHGRVPADVLGQHSTVIWIGNNYQGDLSAWQQTSILPYLESGGNLFLLSRHGQDFIDDNLRDYLGINWAENTTNTIENCVSDFSGLLSMRFTDTQSSNAVFDTKFSSESSKLLFKETTSFTEERALGVWNKPETGGTYRSEGGQFVFISGRPYRFINNDLQSNIEYILENFFEESKISKIEEPIELEILDKFVLGDNYPNPFNPTTAIGYRLSAVSKVDLSIYNVLGQKVVTLVSEKQKAGFHQVEWDGSDFPSGIYYYQIKAGNYQDIKKMILLK